MDVIARLSTRATDPITCIDMHTCGEPTRIIVKGYPSLTGTLLEQRSQAKLQYDGLRRRLLFEPRGHSDMYGAILRPVTEETLTGNAHIGVLFLTNEGYSTMCGHATMALGRFLLDTHDLDVFPARNTLKFNSETSTVQLRLHAPCGVVEVTVPALDEGSRSDPSRPVVFRSIASFAIGLAVEVFLESEERWPELGSRSSVIADFSYGGAFYCLVTAEELGFKNGIRKFDMDAINSATRQLKAAIKSKSELSYLYKHPKHNDLSSLYSVMVVDRTLGVPIGNSKGAETGLCFFADQAVDRSPTGSAVSARLAAAHAHRTLNIGDSWTYHSLVSLHRDSHWGFLGTILHADDASVGKFTSLTTEVQGYAYYTGYHTFILDQGDTLGEGFSMKTLSGQDMLADDAQAKAVFPAFPK